MNPRPSCPPACKVCTDCGTRRHHTCRRRVTCPLTGMTSLCPCCGDRR